MGDINLKIGEVASHLATSIRTIRYYEEEGLLKPIRTQRGTRLYSENHIIRLKVILSLVKIGFSIYSIRKISDIREKSKTGNESSLLVNNYLTELLATINNQVNTLTKLSDEIKNARRTISKCKGCSNQPSTEGCPSCPVRGQLKDIELLNLVWDTK